MCLLDEAFYVLEPVQPYTSFSCSTPTILCVCVTNDFCNILLFFLIQDQISDICRMHNSLDFLDEIVLSGISLAQKNDRNVK